MIIKPIRRTLAQRERAIEMAARVAGVRWIVYARFDGEREIQGLYDDPNEAHATATHVRQVERVSTWTEMVGV